MTKGTSCGLIAVSVALGFSGLVHAQDGAVLDEVIVTAQKREQSMQDVPISMSVLSSAVLERSNITSLSDVKVSVPGLMIQPYPGQSEVLIPTIRGANPNQAIITIPMPIAIHINGVYVGAQTGLNSSVDMERIEVLKGPQGVLSGRNATGGALNIFTARPELGHFGFKQQLTTAERGNLLSKTVLNVPLGEQLAARLTYLFQTRDHEGIRNFAPNGYHMGERDAHSERVDVRWVPSDRLTVDYGYDYALTKSLETAFQCLVPFPGTEMIFPGCDRKYHKRLFAPYKLPKSRNRVSGHTLTVEWAPVEAFTLRSITGYRKLDSDNNSVFVAGYLPGLAATPWFGGTMPLLIRGGATPFNGETTLNVTRLDTWSQEFQFLGDVSENLKYVVGVYYSREKGDQAVGPEPSAYMAHVIPPSAQLPYGGDIARLQDATVRDARNISKAVFAQLSWRPDILNRRLEIAPGIRYTRDRREAVGYNHTGEDYFVTQTGIPLVADLIGAPFLIPGINYKPGPSLEGVHASRSFSKASPGISFNYDVADGMMAYAKYVTGYTTGGFDPSDIDPASFARGFDPEEIRSVEIGFKGEFLERRLRANAAVFRSKYKDEQKTVAAPRNGVTYWIVQNAGGSEYKGAELDLTGVITEDLRLTASGAWLHHKYTKYMIDGIDYAHETRQIVPRFSWSLALDYSFPNFGLPGRVEANVNVSHTDKSASPYTPSVNIREMGFFDPAWLTTPAYTLWNARIAWEPETKAERGWGSLGVALWVRNLTDKKYLAYVNMAPMAASTGKWGERRTAGVDLVYRY